MPFAVNHSAGDESAQPGAHKIYHLIDTEGLPVMRFGRAVRVSYTSLQEWLKQQRRGWSIMRVFCRTGFLLAGSEENYCCQGS
jgi:excisionase family DNA binding protein